MADYRIFPATDGPPDSVSDGQPLNLAMEIRTTGQTWVTALHFWRGTTAITGPIVGRLFTVDDIAAGTPVPGTDVTFTLSGTGWQTALLATPVELSPDVRHKVVVRYADQFPITGAFWSSGPGASGIVNGPLQAYSNTTSVAGQGTFSTGSIDTYPTSEVNAANYWVDLTVTDVDPTSGGPVDLDGHADAAASAKGTLKIARAVRATAPAAATARGAVAVHRGLTARSPAAASARGSITAQRPLNARSAAASSARAALTVVNPSAPVDETYAGGRTVTRWTGGRTAVGWRGGRTIA